jgi:tetratricopeptide (TPR) repeat protein
VSDKRQAALDRAARELDPQTLRDAANRLGGPVGRLMGELADAAAAPLPGAALADVLSQLDPAKGPEQVLDTSVVEGQLAVVTDRLGRLRSAGASMAATHAALMTGLTALTEESGWDPEVEALLADAMDQANAVDVDGVEVVLADLAGLAADLQAAFEGVNRGETDGFADLQSRAGDLDEALRVAAPDLAAIEDVLSRAAELARQRDNAAALPLVQLSTQFAEELHGPDDERVQLRWRVLLDMGLAAEDRGLAWTAGKKVQAQAVDARDWKLVAVVAHKVADLFDIGEPQESMARMEEALALVQLPAYREPGLQLVQTVLANAQGTAAERRVVLMAGQAYEQAGDEAMARRLFNTCLQLNKTEGDPSIVGRAALHLGRLQVDAGLKAQGRDALRLAYNISRGRGDWMLFIGAAPALHAHLVGCKKLEEAAQLRQEALAMGASAGREDVVRQLLS